MIKNDKKMIINNIIILLINMTIICMIILYYSKSMIDIFAYKINQMIKNDNFHVFNKYYNTYNNMSI